MKFLKNKDQQVEKNLLKLMDIEEVLIENISHQDTFLQMKKLITNRFSGSRWFSVRGYDELIYLEFSET